MLQGGAVSVGTGSIADIQDSSFTWNEASSGGALYVSEHGGAKILRADFANNVALQYGGAAHFGGVVNIAESTFHDNTGVEGVSVICSLGVSPTFSATMCLNFLLCRLFCTSRAGWCRQC